MVGLYRSLHRARIHPQRHPAELDARALRRLAGACLALTRQSYEHGGITNTLSRARQLRRRGHAFEEYRFLVYRREGRPCYRCGAPVVKDRFCGKTGYLCPACQTPE